MTRILISLLLFSSLVYGQADSEITYYKDKYRRNVVEKGPYKLEVKKLNDSIINHTFVKLKGEQTIWTKSYLNDQPYGLWETFDKKGNLESTMDYTFILKYGEYIPAGAIRFSELDIPLASDANSKKIQKHIAMNFRYPEVAQELGIMGKVTVQFTIDKTGKLENLSILDGADKSLDTECFRIMNALKELEPYEKDGQKVMVYYTIPLTFKLQ